MGNVPLQKKAQLHSQQVEESNSPLAFGTCEITPRVLCRHLGFLVCE